MSGTRSFVYQPPKGLDPAVFVFHIDLLLLCLFGLYVVLTIPRALFYFFQPTDIFNGLFLRAGSQPVAHVGDPFARASTTRGTKPPIRSTSVRSNRTVSSPFDMPEDGVLKGGTWKSPSGPASPPALIVPQLSAVGLSRLHLTKRHRAPTRVPRWSTVIHPTISYVLNHRVAPGFSFGKLLVLLAYAIVMGYATLYSSDPFTDPLRAGWVCTSQIPIALALVGKTNLLSWASGVCYQKLNYIHQFSGRIIVLTANIHGFGYFYKWSLAGVTLAEKLRDPMFVWGLGALAAVNLLLVSSHSFVRNKMYSLFFTLHIVCVAYFLVATYMHAPFTFPYILIAAGLFAFDRLARLFRTRCTKAWLTGEHALNGGTTLVHVPALGAGWRAGQHVRLRVVSDAWFGELMAWLFGRARPFTIASGSGSGGMILSVKAQGSWTRKLLRKSAGAADARPKERYSDLERGRGPAREVPIIIDGPYGGPGYTLYAAYSGAVLIAGGSGISYVMGVLEDMLQKHASGKSRLRVIEVLWSVSDPDSLYALLPELTPLMQPRPAIHASLSLRFSVHRTRTSARPPVVPRTALPPGMYIRPGRPNILATLQNAIAGVLDAYSGNRSQSAPTPSGIVIGTCGPTSLVDEAARALGRVNWSDWSEVGGVENIEEAFGH